MRYKSIIKTITSVSALATFLVLFQNCAPFTDSEGENITNPIPENEILLRVNQSVGGGFPHLADYIYPPNRNSQTRAIVVIHGGGGTKHNHAFGYGFKKSEDETYNSDPTASDGYQEQFLIDNNVALIFIQGFAIPAHPSSFTWSNHIMTSGYDDKEMLIYFANYLKTQEGFSKVYLVGHSMGGAMANRILCESPATFDGYGSSAGPISSFNAETCAPNPYRPYIHVTGLNDRIIQIVEDRVVGPDINNVDNEFLTLDSLTRTVGGSAFVTPTPEFKNEIPYYQTRVTQKCGMTMSEPQFFPSGDIWTIKSQVDCGGTLSLIQLRDRDHCLATNDAGSYKCDVPLTSPGQMDHLERFIDFFNAN